jgi:hypothetical protein
MPLTIPGVFAAISFSNNISTTSKHHSFTAAPRMASTTTTGIKSRTFSKDWLSDPSTYPLITIMAVAVTGSSGFVFYKIRNCSDVRITSKAKGKVLRTW